MMNEQTKTKSVSILGCTGSVGTQALDTAEKMGVPIRSICAGSDFKKVAEAARRYGVRACAMADENAARELKLRLADTPVKVYAGTDGICEMIASDDAETVVNAITGGAGLLPTLAVLEGGKQLALANKESLVMAGDIVMAKAKEKGITVKPVDSEHCAIFQCLRAGRHGGDDVKRLLLTASGGPFFGLKREELAAITPERALAHPTWKMGPKITVDSATLMNKGFEVIEAKHLFGVDADRITVVVQRESIIHSMVEYIDNTVIAQMSVPDMRSCVAYALTEPYRIESVIDELDLFSVGTLHFDRPDTETFTLLPLAVSAISAGGALPAVLNAANEVAVAAFLRGKIGFTDLFDLVGEAVAVLDEKKNVTDLAGILEADAAARECMRGLIAHRN